MIITELRCVLLALYHRPEMMNQDKMCFRTCLINLFHRVEQTLVQIAYVKGE